ncbi:hypothetical protein [Ralstonia sp. ASV6]|uniref:hypothetical protein n=1 Tax=Ralstonia sp. ASV6 TaxID=2795124 RepID=UPI0018EDF18E|nr:hypothetical protein [Ralstonia sp. ASV6]
MQLTTTIRWKWLALALLLASLLFVRWAGKGLGSIDYITNSPSCTYRVENWSPSIFSGWGWWNAESPGFIRVYRNDTRALIGESRVFDMNGNGQIFWPDPDNRMLIVGNGDDAYFLKLPPGSPPEDYPSPDKHLPPCRYERWN